jgi:hypothetical protein
VLKLKGKHFIDPKRSEILSVFPCTAQIVLFLPKLLPALFLVKPGYPCPFEILAEALFMVTTKPQVVLLPVITQLIDFS